MTKLAFIGNLALDVVDEGPPRPGGPALYAAMTVARLGVEARIAAACAAGDRDLLVGPLEALGLDVTWRQTTATASYTFRYEGDRRHMHQEAVGDPWGAAEAVSAIGDAGWIHVGALVRSDFPEPTLAALADGDRRLLVDAQGLVRTPDLGELRTDAAIGDTLRHIAILKLNDEEAVTLVGRADAEAVRSLGVPEIILTLGSRGSYVVTPTATGSVPAADVEGSVDPTGAGDTYSAVYLIARSTGAEPVEAARAATEHVAEFLAART